MHRYIARCHCECAPSCNCYKNKSAINDLKDVIECAVR